MHDLINDLAQAIAEDIYFWLKNNLEDDKQKKISNKARHSSCVASKYDGIKKFKNFDDARCLRTFLEFSPWRRNYIMRYLLHDLLPMLKCLCELRLCSSGIDELTNSIGDLRHLQYLNVSHSQIRKLSKSVVTLYNLQVLFLKFCEKLEKLPIDMGNLVNPPHVDMTSANILPLEKMPLQIGKLTKLQTLSNFIVGKCNGHRIEELEDLSHIRRVIHISKLENVSSGKDASLLSKEKLKELLLEWNDSHNPQNDKIESDMLNMIRPHNLLERLTIHRYGNSRLSN